MSNTKHIAIVGAGPGGLCAGMLLSQRGFKVSIYDKNSEVGGRNRRFTANGFNFDIGPTFLLMKGVLDEMFQLCDRNSHDYLDFVHLDPMYRLVFDDRELMVSSNAEKMREELVRVFETNRYGYDRFMEHERTRFNRLYPCITRDYTSLSSFISWDLMRALPWLAYPKSVIENLENYFAEEKMRLAFSFQSKYLGMSPWECPALFTMLPYLEHDYGIYHVMGGLNRIASAMATVIREMEGNIYLNTPVKSLLMEKRKVSGLELENGEKVMADEVIINADFAYAMTNLVAPGKLNKYSPDAVSKKQYSCSTFMLYLGLDKLYDLPHHSIVFAQDYRTNIQNIFNGKILSEDFSFYVQNASISDPTLAPSGKSTLYVLVPMPNNESQLEWDEICQKVKNEVLAMLGKRLGLNDLKQHIEYEKIITPKTWETEEHVYKGATFSLAHKFSQMLYWRPHNRFEELENCYLVGGGTHPGSGLPTIYESARISSNLISKKYSIKYKDIKKSQWIKKN